MLATMIGLALVATSCGGSDDDSSPAATADTDTTIAGTTETTTTESTAPSTTAASDVATSTSADAAASPAASALVPEVLCVDDDFGDIAFAVVNEAEEPVLVDAASSVFDNIDPGPFELEPVLFAPGRTSPVYWARPASDAPVVWTLTGPDGTSRTASDDDSTPPCTPELVATTTNDMRTPSIAVGEPTLEADRVTFVSEVVGVPEASVCATGLDPQPVRIVTDDGGTADAVTIEGAVAEWSVELFPNLDGSAGRFGRQVVAAAVLDQCAAAGAVQAVWPGGAFEELYDGVLVCISEDASGALTLTTDDDDPACRTGLPGTGGSRARPG